MQGSLGSVLIAAVALIVIFDFWQKDSLFRELFRHARSAEQLLAARISGFSSTFQDNVPWEELFSKSTRLDLMIAYGATWRNTHTQRIKSFLAKQGVRLGVMLPDPDNDAILNELGRRFSMGGAEVRSKIEEAIAFFTEFRVSFPQKVEIYLMGTCPTHTFYRFDNEAILALYPHHRGRTGVPTFVVERGGEIYEFIRAEWRGLADDGVKAGIVKKIP
ncbi:MAG: hypothetical protein KJ749_04325 [Planctomycetes bacterium]|nr:hypothetical protein [Planctomycetota bacterium]